MPVVLKILPGEFPSQNARNRFRREFNLGHQIEDPNVVRLFSMEPCGHSLVIVEEDFGAEALSEVLPPNGLPIDLFLNMALALSSGLRAIHQAGIIHKDIKPGNIVINTNSNLIKFIDFGTASRAREEEFRDLAPRALEGTVAYMSPEQTGRMNRLLDYRTDFYSLGITFYEMLCGEPPFTSKEALELVHAHMAKEPTPIHRRNPLIPATLAEIINMLIAKDAEDRYQSAKGLFDDLWRCAEEWKERGQISHFTLGENDFASQFHIPSRVFGREAELATLKDLFRKSCDGSRCFLLLEGEAGVGKSALVNEIRQPVAIEHGFFASGTFTELNHQTAFEAIFTALRTLLRQLLTESSAKLAWWRRGFAQALGENANILIPWLPELGLILSSKGKISEVGPTETKHRFLQSLCALIRTVSSSGHPFVLFLDDLQWADIFSCELVDAIYSDQEISHFLMIGAYRPDEQSTNQGFRHFLQKWSSQENTVMRKLNPLKVSHLTDFLSGVLHRKTSETSSLAALFWKKTHGNPFFVIELLNDLRQQGGLYFEEKSRAWCWQESMIKQIEVKGSALQFLIARLKRLKKETFTLIRWASCMGNQFSLDQLAKVAEISEPDCEFHLAQATDYGIILPLEYGLLEGTLPATADQADEPVYKFLHERLRHTVYQLIDDKERAEIHRRIGLVILAQSRSKSKVENILHVVNHLNLGESALQDRDEKLQLADLNFEAGLKARESAAFNSALNYFLKSLKLKGETLWITNFSKDFQLHLHCAECYFFTGNLEKAEEISNLLLEKARTAEEKARVLLMRVAQYTARSKYAKAIRTGLQALAMLNMPLKESPGKPQIVLELIRCRIRLSGILTKDISSLPQLNDSSLAITVKLLSKVSAPAYFAGNQKLFTLCNLKLIHLSLCRGLTPETAAAIMTLAMLEGLVFNNLERSRRLGELAITLAEKCEDPPIQCRTFALAGSLVMGWHKHWRLLTPYLEKALEAGFKSGDVRYTAIAGIHISLWSPDIDFDKAQQLGKQNLLHIEKTKHQDMWSIALLLHQFRKNLLGETKDSLSLDDDQFEEIELLRQMSEDGLASGIAGYYLAKMKIAYLHGNFMQAVDHGISGKNYEKAIIGSLFMVERCFYFFLATTGFLLKTKRKPNAIERKRLKKEMRSMSKWARHCPENFSHLYQHMLAEWAWVSGHDRRGETCFEKAINQAGHQGYDFFQAIIATRAAVFHQEKHRNRLARLYMKDAIYLYDRWGAKGIAHYLEEEFHRLLRPHGENEQGIDVLNSMSGRPVGSVTGSISQSRSTGSSHNKDENKAALDLASLAKAAQAIASEIELEKLLHNTLHIMIESAGAQKGVLLLSTPNGLNVEASVDTSGHSGFGIGPLARNATLPGGLIRFAYRTGERIQWPDREKTLWLEKDPVLGEGMIKSVLCLPVKHQDRPLGVLYLENNLSQEVFTHDRIKILELLIPQAAISIENARLFAKTKLAEAAERKLKEELELRVKERTHQLELAQKELVDKAHQAGMATIATSVLHNVGNLLNGVVTSTQLIREAAEGAGMEGLVKANLLLRKNMDDLARFVAEDPRATQLMQYYLQIGQIIENERQEIVENAGELDHQVEAIREVIASQESYIEGRELVEQINLADLIQDVLAIQEGFLSDHQIMIQREYQPVPPVLGSKLKLVSVLINLIRNAVEAMADTPPSGRLLILSMEKITNCVRLGITDNGKGVEAEQKEKIFTQAFVAKAHNKGYSLHDCANAMTEMGGKLWVESPGKGKGATFYLTFKDDALSTNLF